MPKKTRWEQLRDEWSMLSVYQRFESLVALVLTAVIGMIIVVALFRLAFQVVTGLVFGSIRSTRALSSSCSARCSRC